MLCFCMGFSHEEVEQMINDGGFASIEEFQKETFVGTGCGRCLPVIDDIFDQKENKDLSPEQ